MLDFGDAPQRVAAAYPSYRDFVDAALFAPSWGYYSTGAIRFGDGGHYDTYPIALSPVFGEIIAARAFRQWVRCGRPARFDVCELGAGNGQLCLDVLVTVVRRGGQSAAWRTFDRALRYRIVERSPALAARQRAKLGPLVARVRWRVVDLSSTGTVPRMGDAALVVANEVLDCLAHHKIARPAGTAPAVAFVVPRVGGRTIPARELDGVMSDSRQRRRVRYHEVDLPLAVVPELATLCADYLPELHTTRRDRPAYFAAPELPRLIGNVGRLYRRSEMLWIDYGDTRAFHLRAPERRKVFAGPPRSGHGIYDRPGEDDITFMVDFTLAMDAARAAGLRVVDYGPQSNLLRGTGLRVDETAIDRILQYRAVEWMLALVGPDPEATWRKGSLTWDKRRARGGSMRASVARDLDTFLGRRRNTFRVLVLRRE
ncbi:MAG TPA: SAM-dependent methyltransferase [Candidatus Binatia bacterium]|jgi:SAM-dependent MidA family methyltransferase|nr:SAM-dependent methyltransferase [Candidatus Binatia bacterium]